MERFYSPFPLGRHEPSPSPAAVRLAAALAERLDTVVPRPLRVRAEGGWVTVFAGDTPYSGSGVAAVLDQPADLDDLDERRSSWEIVASVAWNVLSGVQDAVAETTTEPWPRLPGGGMATPGARADGDRVLLWYGPDHVSEVGAVLELPPIPLRAVDELGGGG
jgi:hypothetical protein